MKCNASITCRSMSPEDIESLFELCWEADVSFSADSRALSGLDNDTLANSVDIKSYLQDYFMGKCLQPPKSVAMAEIEHLPPIQILDLLYRSGDLATYEAWIMNRISSFINSRRVFAIASLLGFRKTTDCFIEMHAREWFGPLTSLIPDSAPHSMSASPYLVSPEASAKKIGNAFFIHSGTNYWNRAWLPTTKWDERWDVHLRNWRALIMRSEKMAKKLGAKNVQFLFVPEKDTLARIATPGVFQSGFLPMIMIQKLMDVAPTGSVLFPVVELVDGQDAMVRLQAGDSHLSAQDYWAMFKLLLARFGLEKHGERDCRFDFVPNPGDLGSKFNNTAGQRQTIEFDMSPPIVAGGQTELQIPLRDNYVYYKNPDAPIKKSLLILGDSHASTGSNPFFTFIASHFFSHVEFFWNPFNVHDMPLKQLALSSYNYILCETSQRFATPTVN